MLRVRTSAVETVPANDADALACASAAPDSGIVSDIVPAPAATACASEES